MIRLLAATALGALLLAACTPYRAAPAKPDGDASAETASVAAAPIKPDGFQLEYLLESETYTVQLDIDPAILAFDPALAYRLWTDGKAELDALGVSAGEGRAMADEAAAETGEAPWFTGYLLNIAHKATAVFDDVISISDTVDTYTGGAHPNYFLTGGNYHKGETGALPLSAFVSDSAAFNELVIKALVLQKIERGYAAAESASIESGLRELLAPSAEIPDIYKSNFVLLPSTEPGKVGGIMVMFSPYDVGSYAEGAYTVTFPAADLAPILTQSWAGRFGGEPVIEDGEPVIEEE